MDTNKIAFNMDVLATLSIEQLTEVKAKVMELLKSRKVEVKEAAKVEKETVKLTAVQMTSAAIAAKVLRVGSVITFTMNGKTWTKPALKISDKTVTVDMGTDVDTVKTMRYIHFDKITNVEASTLVEEVVEVVKPKAKLIKKAKGEVPAVVATVADFNEMLDAVAV